MNSEVNRFNRDLDFIFKIPTVKKYEKISVEEYPFDRQLLSLSRIYRTSRKHYLALGGRFEAKVCSTMRSLSAQDLFLDKIEYSPILSELLWFKDHSQEVVDPVVLMNALSCYNEISLFHEQNHRVLWRILPPAPEEKPDFCRYLNFAESLVVTLDLALGDELGSRTSPVFERMKVIYRSGGHRQREMRSKKAYRRYLLALMYVTYLVLELIDPRDIPRALNYIFPDQRDLNKDAVRRGKDLNELFTLNTNQQWQQRFWQQARDRLSKIHRDSPEDQFYLSDDPLDFKEEFAVANRVFEYYGL